MSTYVVTNVHSLRHPVRRDATAQGSRESVDVLGCGTAVLVDVARQAGAVLGVTDEEHALNCVEGGAGEARHGVHGCGGALGVAFQNYAHIGVGADEGGDFVDDLGYVSAYCLDMWVVIG